MPWWIFHLNLCSSTLCVSVEVFTCRFKMAYIQNINDIWEPVMIPTSVYSYQQDFYRVQQIIRILVSVILFGFTSSVIGLMQKHNLIGKGNKHIDQGHGCDHGAGLQRAPRRDFFWAQLNCVTVIIEWLGSGRTWECFRHHHFLPIHHIQPGGTRPQMPCKILIPMQLAW